MKKSLIFFLTCQKEKHNKIPAKTLFHKSILCPKIHLSEKGNIFESKSGFLPWKITYYGDLLFAD